MGKITLKIGEIKRRTKKIGAFPSDDSAMRLAGSIIMDINEEYVTGRKYINTYIRLSIVIFYLQFNDHYAYLL